MRKYIETEVIVKELECVGVTCNRCGEDKVDSTMVKIDFDYGSKFDMQHWVFDLCDDCVQEVVQDFKIPVEKPKEYY
jgi:hypothetical protein